jgi:hypothetical protein
LLLRKKVETPFLAFFMGGKITLKDFLAFLARKQNLKATDSRKNQNGSKIRQKLKQE